MTKNQVSVLIFVVFLGAVGLILIGLTGRFVWVPGQNNIHEKNYLPRVFDTWTGKYETMF